MIDAVPLREVFNLQLNALDEKLDAFIVHAKDKFASQNEFRGALSDQARELLPRNEYNVQHKALEDKTDAGLLRVNNESYARHTGNSERIDSNIHRMGNIELALSTLQASMAARKEGIGSIGSIVLGVMAAVAMLASVAAVLITLLRPIVH